MPRIAVVETVEPMLKSRRHAPIPNPLQAVAFLDDAERDVLARRHTVVTVAPGTRICRQGRTGNELMFVLAGTADVVRNGETVASVTAGDVLGERSMLGLRVYQDADVLATSEVTLAAVSRREFLDAVGERPSFRETLAGLAAERQG